jgi:hypothetical protein
MVDLANAALQAAAAQNVNTTALTFIGAQLTRPDIGELTRRAQAIRRSSLDLKLLDRMLSPLEARRDKALRCVTDASVAHQLRESKDRTTARMFFGSSKANGGLAMASERQIVAKPRPWPHAAAVNYLWNSLWRNSTKASFLSNIGKE